LNDGREYTRLIARSSSIAFVFSTGRTCTPLVSVLKREPTVIPRAKHMRVSELMLASVMPRSN